MKLWNSFFNGDSFFQCNLILIDPVLFYAFTTGSCYNLMSNNLKPTIKYLGTFSKHRKRAKKCMS